MAKVPQPKFHRRPEERPAQILAAALQVFAECGFAAARLDDVARRAGVSKGAIYLYFETKEQLFTAVVTEMIAPNLEAARAAVRAADMPFDQVVRAAVGRMAGVIVADRRITGIAKLVIAESRSRPELAMVWRQTMIGPGLSLLTGLIEAAQARGEVRAGDARAFAMGLIGPLLMGVLWRETFEPVGAEPVDIPALVAQHLDTVLRGMKP